MRYQWAVIFLVLITVGALGSAFVGPQGVEDGRDPPANQLIRPDNSDTYVWPYTSRSRSIEDRTLALNVVIVGSPAEVHHVLTDRSELEWAPADSDEGLNQSRSVSPWRSARGAARYTYVGTGVEDGRWVESDYQLATGTYLGSRTHVRAYPGPSDKWTALQTHTEYWDWYRLRHSVTAVSEGARTLEGDLRDEPFVHEVRRVYHGHSGGGSDGWMTVIELTATTRVIGTSSGTQSAVAPSNPGAPAAMFGLPVSGFHPASIVGAPAPVPGVLALAPLAAFLAVHIPPARRDAVRDAVLPVSLAAIVLGVRLLGIAAEGLFPATNPKVFAGVLYPVLVLGPLAVTARLARGRPGARTAVLAAAGLGAGFVLELGAVGVRVVPIRLVLHRTALLGALGLFALGVADTQRRTVVAGVLIWLGFLAGSVFGFV